MTDSDSSSDECAGMKRASSVKKTEPTFKIVPEKKKFKFEITTGDRVEKFLYKLKKDTPLPYKTILEGIESKLVFVKDVTLCSIIGFEISFSGSLKPSLHGFLGAEKDGWWIFKLDGKSI